MKVLVACEFSGVVRQAYRNRGHEAYSCDIRPAEDGSPYHIQGDVLRHLDDGWDLLIAHPPCTHLAVSGAKHFRRKRKRQRKALEFFLALLNAPVRMVCVENPVSVSSSYIRPPDQIVQPWMFGDPFQKTTCLWLENLPPLRPTKIVDRGEMFRTSGGNVLPKWYSHAPIKDRDKIRSRTFPGLAAAMADQWDRPYKRGFGLRVKDRIRKEIP